MGYRSDNPIMIHHDYSIIMDTNHPESEKIREILAGFADLIQTPNHYHTYRITPMSLWNAAASGVTGKHIQIFLTQYTKSDLPMQWFEQIYIIIGRYGMLRMETQDGKLVLIAEQPKLLDELSTFSSIKAMLGSRENSNTFLISSGCRGFIKQELIRHGYPVRDIAGYRSGERLEIHLNSDSDNEPVSLRDYQQDAVRAFEEAGQEEGGSGVLVLPCGAGKTVIGLAIMAQCGSATLIVTSNNTSVKQWKQEILHKTNLTEEWVGEYTGATKSVRPVTIATYQILSHRHSHQEEFKHMALFNRRDWGLIIYDEVHLLPAPVFRETAKIQATRRLGLTATLVREDGKEDEVFSLIGPKRFDASWKKLEQHGWIARAYCEEIRIPLGTENDYRYWHADAKSKMRLASENPFKLHYVRKLIARHANAQILIIGQYLEQLKRIAKEFQIPLITGETPNALRHMLYDQFRKGEYKQLVVSKVANFAVDLPDASVAIQVSGSYGSRQEEAQRLGRILRPKSSLNKNEAYFYSLISKNTKEQEYALNRQMFLVKQGYEYRIIDGEEQISNEI